MTDKDFNLLGFVAIVVIILYLLVKKGETASAATPAQAAEAAGALPVSWDTPMLAPYDANPNAYSPASPSQLTINVNNPLANSLTNQYVPLFGFVGMAQGSMYQ